MKTPRKTSLLSLSVAFVFVALAIPAFGDAVFTLGPYGSKNGNNFLTITTINGEAIACVTIDSAGGFQDLQQPRVSGISGVAGPEPSTLLLLGSGLLGFAAVLRRKRSR